MPARLPCVRRLSALPIAGAIAMLALFTPAPVLLAHDGPEHEIEEITTQMAAHGATADLLVDRALEYLLLGKNADAQQDLEHALRLQPHHPQALRELARVQSASGEPAQARTTLDRALQVPGIPATEHAELLIQRAELLKALGHPRAALADCESALRLHRSHPEWYLLRSDLQRILGLHRRRLAGLEQGLRETGAGVLSTERLDALLDAGRHREALPLIESELAASRIKVRWRVRHGRALLGVRRTEEGRAELRAALLEMEALRQAPKPDPSLLVDQAVAQVLLNERDAAARTLELARAVSGHPEIARQISEWLERRDGNASRRR